MNDKPEPQMDSCMVICPYCLAEYQAEAESYNSDEREEECDKCGRKFIRFDQVDVTIYTLPIKEYGQ
jgi:uncharacterized Zn ribbon protein